MRNLWFKGKGQNRKLLLFLVRAIFFVTIPLLFVAAVLEVTVSARIVGML